MHQRPHHLDKGTMHHRLVLLAVLKTKDQARFCQLLLLTPMCLWAVCRLPN